ncbi:GAF domain-containing protein [Streptomyces sp. H27-C3]|uniref:sensor histidine kinase n=1 Tax=Streptomyces sp. H27-C3 TaxID=3046305 RepID=UPI0024B9A708|nr:GAF domain-containing protein [Streptomyces sp. H27-C3]MDJ0465545.1 GAF domain-containing protein [Streptomyces sp. H27-C3]
MRLDELLEDLQSQVAQVNSPRDRVPALLEAVLAVGSELDLAVVLRQLVQSAVTLVDARYGALGVIGEESGLRQFITVGMDEETIAQIGPSPQGGGILGLLIREPHSLRLVDLGQHPEASGFPAGHPPMRTFLGAPVRVREKVFGNLYLTEKRGGAEFDADDEAVLTTLAAAAGVAVDNARLYDAVQRRERWLLASSELTRALLSGTDPGEVLDSFTATVLEMAGADSVTLAVPASRNGNLLIEAAAGQDADHARGLVLSDAGLARKVYTSGETITTEDWNSDPRAEQDTARTPLGPAFLVPLGTPEHVRGVLQVAGLQGCPAFAEATVAMIAGFANHAALALEIAGHRRDAERLLVLTDRDRIARDLHDLAIQRLFASGLSLQSTLGQVADRPRVSERIARVVDDLDDTIKVIRSTIYALQQQGRPEDTGLRSRLVAESGLAAEGLGFAPALRTTGLLDTLVSHTMADHLLAVLREALANAARHAHATSVEVTAEVTTAHLRLRVADNGCGTGSARAHGSGLANLYSRATELGGTFTLAANQPTGTVVDWRVPLPAVNG